MPQLILYLMILLDFTCTGCYSWLIPKLEAKISNSVRRLLCLFLWVRWLDAMLLFDTNRFFKISPSEKTKQANSNLQLKISRPVREKDKLKLKPATSRNKLKLQIANWWYKQRHKLIQLEKWWAKECTINGLILLLRRSNYIIS